LVTACWQSATTWCRQAALSRPCAPTVGFVVARCCAGRPVMRSSQPFSHGHWASIRSIAWRAVSSSDWVAAGTAATRDVLRARRFRAPAQPPRRPTLRHWSMVRLKGYCRVRGSWQLDSLIGSRRTSSGIPHHAADSPDQKANALVRRQTEAGREGTHEKPGSGTAERC